MTHSIDMYVHHLTSTDMQSTDAFTFARSTGIGDHGPDEFKHFCKAHVCGPRCEALGLMEGEPLVEYISSNEEE